MNSRFLKNLRRESSRKREDIRRNWGNEFYEYIRDIAEHPKVQEMKLYPHHGNTNCYQHCLHVAYCNYVLGKYFRLDARSAARGGMMHDMFLYDWHTHAKETGKRFHGLTHPAEALQHAEEIFVLNEKEKDIIYNHMWPVTFYRLPHCRETWITTLTDKYCGVLETWYRKKRGE